MRVLPAVRSRAYRAVTGTTGSLRFLLGLLLVSTLLAGCASGSGSGPSGDDDAGGGSSSLAAGEETFDTPEPEPTTPDTPGGPSSNDNPAIQVARLPVGGGSEPDPSDPALQCAQVSWVGNSGGEIPKGTGVELTGIIFDPASFEAVAKGCGGQRPSCLHYVFRTSALHCDLAVRATGAVPQDANPTLGFSGLVFCPDSDSDTCRRFVAALGDEEQVTVSLDVPELPPATTEPTEPVEPTQTTASTDPTEPVDGSTDSPTTDGG